MPDKQITLLDAPSNLGLKPPRPGAEPGVRGLPSALRGHQLATRLGAADAGALAAPAYSPDPEHTTGFRNGPAIAAFTSQLADRITDLLNANQFPLVLGGDCSIVLGATLALRRRGRYGLAFLDGHDDYSYPREPEALAGRFAAAGLDLALATGHGPDALCDLEGLRPYLTERDVVHLGHQYEPGDTDFAKTETFAESDIRRYSAEDIRRLGAHEAAAQARARLEEHPGFWLHLDADVLHASVMPAVDSPNPNGLSAGELTTVLTVLLDSPAAVGMHVAIYDPELDPTGAAGALLTDILVTALASGRV
jgi:arginase